ncbi:nucleoside triphosphate pyrophosphohydrolase, partial [Dissulfurirhabdus thermomarina]
SPCSPAALAMDRLLAIIRRLRGPGGCPWDREQTPASVRKYVLEEAYELLDALDQGRPEEIREEIGDLVFMLLFLAHLFEEAGRFTLAEALEASGRKMIRRHPHIFGDVEAEDTETVMANWREIKAEEARSKGRRHSALGNLPRALPALQRAYRVGERASRIGFDWDRAEDVLPKVREEAEELAGARRTGDPGRVAAELGDLLFSMANLARHLGVNPEEALQGATNRFVERFQRMEACLEAAGKDPAACTPEELDAAWNDVKRREEEPVPRP